MTPVPPRPAHGRHIRHARYDLDERPFIVIWEVTRACELVCAHCRAEATPDRHPAELDTEQGRRLLEQIADFGRPPPLVVLTGGDPFTRDDLAELVAHGTALGLPMALSPSVTPLVTPDALARMREAGAHAVSLSLDGATASTHDGFRGFAGTFEATLEAAGWVHDAGMRLQLNTTVTAPLLDELPAIFETAVELEAFLWSVFFLVGTGRGSMLSPPTAGETEDVLHFLADAASYLPVKTTEAPHFRRVLLQRAALPEGADPAEHLGLGPTYRRLRAALHEVVARRGLRHRVARPPLDVNAGRGFVFVSHVGAVTPSGFLPVTAGTVREQALAAIYRSSTLLTGLRDPSRLGGRCGRCEFAEMCGGSRSRAFAETGDPWAEDPLCGYDPPAPKKPATSPAGAA